MNKIIVIAGPTASGKTELGIQVANAVNGEIISADSMQIYKDMPIATAAPTKEEKARAVHHLTEFLKLGESFSVAAWCELAKEKANDILSRGKVPVIVGGTGLFIDSFVDNIIFDKTEVDEKLRQRLMERDAQDLYDELVRLDPKAAENIHKNNKKRVARALELCLSGTSKTEQNINSRRKKSPYEFLYIVVEYENRQTLYDRINVRVDEMIKNGLADEARYILSMQTKTSAQAIGHKELAKYLDGSITLDEAVQKLKQETRRYAKRQITWFKRRENAVRINFDGDREEAARAVISMCGDFLNG